MSYIIGCVVMHAIGFKGGEGMSDIDDIKEKENLDDEINKLEQAIRAWLEERENRRKK